MRIYHWLYPSVSPQGKAPCMVPHSFSRSYICPAVTITGILTVKSIIPITRPPTSGRYQNTRSNTDMGGVESIPTDPSQRVQVISAGYSRTGTVSMSLAVAKLVDGPVFHGGTQILTRDDGKQAPMIHRLKPRTNGALTSYRLLLHRGQSLPRPQRREQGRGS